MRQKLVRSLHLCRSFRINPHLICITSFVLFLSLVLALVPNPTYASQVVYSSTANSSNGSFTNYYYGGCLFRSYNNVLFDDYLVSSPYLLTRLSSGDKGCNYRVFNDELVYSSDSSVGTQVSSVTNGVLNKGTFEFASGNNSASSWDASDYYYYGDNVRAVYNGSFYEFPNSSPLIVSQPANYDQYSYALGFFKYTPDYPSWAGSYGTIPSVSASVTPLTNDPDSSSEETFLDVIAESLHDYSTVVYGTKIRDYFPNFDEIYCGSSGLGYVSCDTLNEQDVFVVFSFPISQRHSFVFHNFSYWSSSACDYNLKIEGSDASCTELDYMVRFLAYGPTFKSLASSPTSNTSAFSSSFVDLSDQIFYIEACDSKAECDNFLNYRNLYHSSRVDFIANGGQSSSDSGNIFASWFDVFRLDTFFPFAVFFNGWTSHSTCVDIPILASWLSLPSSTNYCSWWPASVIGVTTPVFTILSSMLLFGFVFRWLNDSDGGKT